MNPRGQYMYKHYKNILNCLNQTLAKRKSSTQQMNEVIIEKFNNIGVITLNRPKALNALNTSMIDRILPILNEWENDATIHAAYIRGGSNNKFFCAGGDIKAIREKAIGGDTLGALEFFKKEYSLNYKIANLKKPYIALIHGITMGGGVGLSIHGKIRIATEKTLFAMPETAIGFFPDIGGSYILSRLNNNLGIYLALTGNRLSGREVLQAGIANNFIQSADIDKFEKKLFDLNKPDEKKILSLVREFGSDGLDESKQQSLSDDLLKKINSIFGASTVEEIYENLKLDNTAWANKQIETLNRMSPTSLKVTLRQMHLVRTKSLKEVLDMDYQLCQRFAHENDFFEGVRALLIDKDGKPKWNPSKIGDVKMEKIDWFFQTLNSDDKLNF